MRVLFVTHSFPRFSGDVAGAFILRLACALADTGTEVRVLAPAAPRLANSDVIDGIAVRRFRYAPRRWETLAYTGTMAECAITRLTRQPRIPPDLPPALARLLRQMTVRVPAARSTAAAVRQALDANEKLPAPDDSAATAVTRPIVPRLSAVLAGVLVAGAVVAYSFSFPTAVQGNPVSAPPSAVAPPSSTLPQPSSPSSPVTGNPVAVTGAPQPPSAADAGRAVSPPAGAPGGPEKPGKGSKKNIFKGKGHGGGPGPGDW